MILRILIDADKSMLAVVHQVGKGPENLSDFLSEGGASQHVSGKIVNVDG